MESAPPADRPPVIRSFPRGGRLRRLSVFLTLTLLPFVVTAVHSACCRRNLFAGIPHNSDEFCYWRVLYSFSKRGFDIASTCGMLGCEAPRGPLGEHGLSTLFAWAIALPFHVGSHTLFLCNLAMLSFSLALFALLVRPNATTALWAILLVLGNGMVVEQWYSHMMELPCLAAIIVFFSLALAWENTGRRGFLCLALVVCAYASFMRVCYIVLAFPLVLRLCLPSGKKPSPWPLLAYLASFVVIRKFGLLFTKPSNSFLTDIAEMEGVQKVAHLADHFALNAGSYFSFTNGTSIEIGQRWFQVVLFAILLVAAILARRKEKPAAALVYIANALSLAALVAMLMLLYEVADWSGMRTTMPFSVGLSLWFVAKSFSPEGGLPRRSGSVARGALFAAAVGCLFVFAPRKIASNHPDDRFGKTSFDLSWLADIPDEKTRFCIFEPHLSPARQMALYKRLPPRVGIAIAPSKLALALADPKPDFVLTSHRLDLPEYEIWKKPEGFAQLYRKSSPKISESDGSAIGDKEGK